MTVETPLTAVLRTVARSTDTLLARRLQPLNLTPSRLEVLAAIAETPGGSAADAARQCNITDQTAGITVAHLKEAGLVVETGASVGRSAPIAATDAGLEALDKAWDATRPLEKRLAMLLGAAGIRRVRGVAEALGASVVDARKPAAGPAEDPRHAGLTNAALGLHYRALTWAQQRGVNTVPDRQVRRWTSPQAGLIGRLVDAGMWKPDGDDAYRVR